MSDIKQQILESVIINNSKYLNMALASVDDNLKSQIESLFYRHMEEISDFIIENFIKKLFLEESFIKNLHKIFFPKGFMEKKRTSSGFGEVVIMIPGQYKTLKNFDRISPSDVKKEMYNLVEYYNSNIIKSDDKFDIIIRFLLKFLKIHPFGNGNARTISPIIDVMLIKYNLNPIYFNFNQLKNTELFNKTVDEAIKSNNIENLKKEIINHL